MAAHYRRCLCVCQMSAHLPEMLSLSVCLHIVRSSCKAQGDRESKLENTNTLPTSHHKSEVADFALLPSKYYFCVCVCNIYSIPIQIILKEKFSGVSFNRSKLI